MEKPVARVLVVEDQPEVSSLMRIVLGRAHIDATIVTTGEEALTRLTTETYGLILLDVNLAGISGLEVCRRLKADEQFKGIPVVIVSGQDSRHIQQEAQRLGAVDFIAKPFGVLDFLARIQGHLNLRLGGEEDLRKLFTLPRP